MSIVASPTQQGVTQLPSAAHLQTNILNGQVRVASSNNPGVQNAVYTISGGPITSNVNLTLPALNSDDTIATLGTNNLWTAQHTFTQGLTANGPINSTAPISTSSSITGSTLLSQGSITSNGPITGASTLTTTSDISTGGNVILSGAINPSGTTNVLHLSASGNITTTVGNIVNTGTQTQLVPTQSAYGTQMLLRNDHGGTDGDFFGVGVGGNPGGGSKGCIVATATNQRLGFFNTSPTPQMGSQGAVTVPSTYNATVQGIIQLVYNNMRLIGLMN